MMDFTILPDIIQKYGYGAVFFAMLLEGACMPVPSELVLGFAGFLVYQGKMTFAGAVCAAWLGSLTGSFITYSAARYGGRRFLYKWGHFIHITPRRIDTFTAWFNHYGPLVIIPWRLLPVMRPKISIAAGLLKMKRRVFLACTALGIAAWCTLGVFLGSYFGYKWSSLVTVLPAYPPEARLVIAGLIIAAGAGIVLYAKARMRKINEYIN